jgi:hypothetical protein
VLAHDQATGRRFIGKGEERTDEQRQTRAFLEGECECMTWWCELAEVDEGKVRRKAEALTGRT